MNSNTCLQRGYSVLPSLVTGSYLEHLLDHVLTVGRRLGDQGDFLVPGTPAVYGNPFTETLLEELVPRVEAETGVSVYPTYSYFRVYKTGDRLPKHKDRPACEISLTLSLGYEPDEPWPFWMEADGNPVQVSLQRGDAVLYLGAQIVHWREEFRGDYAAQVFLHYVDRNGPNQEWKFDKRSALRMPPRV